MLELAQEIDRRAKSPIRTMAEKLKRSDLDALVELLAEVDPDFAEENAPAGSPAETLIALAHEHDHRATVTEPRPRGGEDVTGMPYDAVADSSTDDDEGATPDDYIP
ncbi:hypothetical protein M0E78_00705 [Corynebacterium sp. P6145]|uniref:hypothetical protein n=1 Tax=Corynebacterium antarcticum TaxID=2800405 RepID=UPI002004225F|nr:hypothetical protein [Corynebacterium antarcticum]MCK7641445.1 hypothetical protein [Corynebacterium antarcticum]MCX7491046.1 hypothetical protein [Corynebacterium antarcticum]